MRLHQITLREAYLIETLRSKGITNEELIEEANVESWNRLHDSYDFNELISMRKIDFTAFQSIIENGYRVKFVTFKGLKNLLFLKFNKLEDIDYEVMERGIRGLQLRDEEREILENLLSQNWQIIVEKANGNEYISVELV